MRLKKKLKSGQAQAREAVQKKYMGIISDLKARFEDVASQLKIKTSDLSVTKVDRDALSRQFKELASENAALKKRLGHATDETSDGTATSRARGDVSVHDAIQVLVDRHAAHVKTLEGQLKDARDGTDALNAECGKFKLDIARLRGAVEAAQRQLDVEVNAHAKTNAHLTTVTQRVEQDHERVARLEKELRASVESGRVQSSQMLDARMKAERAEASASSLSRARNDLETSYKELCERSEAQAKEVVTLQASLKDALRHLSALTERGQVRLQHAESATMMSLEETSRLREELAAERRQREEAVKSVLDVRKQHVDDMKDLETRFSSASREWVQERDGELVRLRRELAESQLQLRQLQVQSLALVSAGQAGQAGGADGKVEVDAAMKSDVDQGLLGNVASDAAASVSRDGGQDDASDLASLKCHAKRLQEENAILEAERDSFRTIVDDMKKTETATDKKVATLQERLDAAEKEKQETAATVQVQIAKAEAATIEKQAKCDELEASMVSLRDEIAAYEEHKKQAQPLAQELKEATESMQTASDAHAAQMAALQTTLNDTQAEQVKSQQECAAALEVVSMKELELNVAKKELASAQARVEEVKAAMNSERTSLLDVQEGLKKQLSVFRETNEALQRATVANAASIVDASVAAAASADAVSEAAGHPVEKLLIKQLEGNLVKLRDEYVSLSDQKAEVEATLRRVKREKGELKQRTEGVEARLTSMEAERAAREHGKFVSNEEHAQIVRREEELVKEFDGMKEKIAQLQGDLTSAQALKEMQNARMTQLTQSRMRLKEALKRKEGELEKALKDVENTASAKAEASSRCDALTAQLEEAKRAHAETEVSLITVKGELSVVSNKLEAVSQVQGGVGARAAVIASSTSEIEQPKKAEEVKKLVDVKVSVASALEGPVVALAEPEESEAADGGSGGRASYAVTSVWEQGEALATKAIEAFEAENVEDGGGGGSWEEQGADDVVKEGEAPVAHASDDADTSSPATGGHATKAQGTGVDGGAQDGTSPADKPTGAANVWTWGDHPTVTETTMQPVTKTEVDADANNDLTNSGKTDEGTDAGAGHARDAGGDTDTTKVGGDEGSTQAEEDGTHGQDDEHDKNTTDKGEESSGGRAGGGSFGSAFAVPKAPDAAAVAKATKSPSSGTSAFPFRDTLPLKRTTSSIFGGESASDSGLRPGGSTFFGGGASFETADGGAAASSGASVFGVRPAAAATSTSGSGGSGGTGIFQGWNKLGAGSGGFFGDAAASTSSSSKAGASDTKVTPLFGGAFALGSSGGDGGPSGASDESSKEAGNTGGEQGPKSADGSEKKK